MNSKTASKALCHGYYVAFGMVGIGLLPGLVKSFEDAFSLSHTRMGLIMAAGAATFAVASFAGGVLFDRRGGRLVMSLAAGLSGLFALAVFFSPKVLFFIPALLLFHAANGLGQVVNPLVGRLYGPRRAQGINLLHGFQGVGRLLAPLLIAACIAATGGWRVTFVVSGGVFALLLLLFLLGPDEGTALPDGPPAATTSPQWDSALVVGIVAFGFLSACESVIITWLPTFLESERKFPKATALLGLSFVMLGYTCVRMLIGVSRGRSLSRFIIATPVPLFGFMLALLSVRSIPLVFLSCFLLGFSFGMYWPSHAAAMFEYSPHAHGVLSAWFNVASVVGGMVLISLAGWLGDVFGLGWALLTAPAAAVVYVSLYACFLVLGARRRRLEER